MDRTEHQACVWDFTMWTSPNEWESHKLQLRKLFREHTKKWCFQLEKSPSTNRLHFQGRVSLKLKKRLQEAVKQFPPGTHLTPTSKANWDNTFYVTKEETRINGPWSDQATGFIPKQIQKVVALLPWQSSLRDVLNTPTERTIHIVNDKAGNVGKSTFVGYMEMKNQPRAMAIEAMPSYKDIMRMVMNMLPDAPDEDDEFIFLIDMPRVMASMKEAVALFGAIETIKNGKAWDDRYHFRRKFFNTPEVCVFCNERPDERWLSADRWKYYEIDPDSFALLEL